MHALAMGFGALVVFAPTDQAASFVLMSCSPGQFAGKPAEPNGLTVACGGSFNLCGYVDQSKNQVIPWRFEVALPFSDGFAGVRINGKFGFIDRAGKLVVPAKFDVVAGFTKGLAEVVLDGKAGVIDRSGNFVVEPNYARAMPFGEDTVLVSEGAWQAAGFNGCESLRDAKRTLQLEFVKNPSPLSPLARSDPIPEFGNLQTSILRRPGPSVALGQHRRQQFGRVRAPAIGWNLANHSPI